MDEAKSNPCMDELKIRPLDRWQVFRKYLEHEDGLIHQRLNWMLLLQGFFFAAFVSIHAGLLAAQLDTYDKVPAVIHNAFPTLIETLRTLSYVIPILGYLIAFFSLLGVHAARRAIELLARRWEQELYTSPKAEIGTEPIQCYRHFPGITGGGEKHVREIDTSLPYGIPIALCVGWVAIGTALLPEGSSALSHAWIWRLVSLPPLLPPALMLLNFGIWRTLRWFIKRYKVFEKMCYPESKTEGGRSIRHLCTNLKSQWVDYRREFIDCIDQEIADESPKSKFNGVLPGAKT